MQNRMKKPPIGLMIDYKEQDELHRLCLKYGLPILYEESFHDGLKHYLWAFDENGIGLTGTYIMQRLPKVLYGLKEFEDCLIKSQKCQ